MREGGAMLVLVGWLFLLGVIPAMARFFGASWGNIDPKTLEAFAALALFF